MPVLVRTFGRVKRGKNLFTMGNTLPPAVSHSPVPLGQKGFWFMSHVLHTVKVAVSSLNESQVGILLTELELACCYLRILSRRRARKRPRPKATPLARN